MEGDGQIQRELGRIGEKIDGIGRSFDNFRQTILSDIVEHRAESGRKHENLEKRVRDLEKEAAGERGASRAHARLATLAGAFSGAVVAVVTAFLYHP